jgi:hypothetical protein
MEQKIKSLTRGHGEDAEFFTSELRYKNTSFYVNEIKPVYKRTGWKKKQVIGYDIIKNGKRIAYCESGNLLLQFEQNKETTEL